jgi:hypothetical protein
MKIQIGYGLRATGYGLRATGYGLRATGYGLRATGYGLVLFAVNAISLAQTEPSLLLKHNQSLGFSRSVQTQNYREIDRQALTPDGTLNSETGKSTSYAIQARYQSPPNFPLPLWLELNSSKSAGQTQYRGYLQSGSLLTPFAALTGNEWKNHALRVGLPWSFELASMPAQLIPYLGLERHLWQRNLLQYSETYRQKSTNLGLLFQAQIAQNWIAEIGAQRSFSHRAELNVPSLNFAADQPASARNHFKASVAYRIHPQWQLSLNAEQTRYKTEASPVVSGLQSPPSNAEQTRLGMALSWLY